ncbi:hypothetical protein DPMN_025895 [Dreissena polymorpha]|uniref:Uncharacterized protein n=1 Tax=Dreissena polymorpha TaxID=45954 RepID=A0A9D4RE23_DREPO|nr:hypothetical protein DPMN_025895 [Dreissena polymorpha]
MQLMFGVERQFAFDKHGVWNIIGPVVVVDVAAVVVVVVVAAVVIVAVVVVVVISAYVAAAVVAVSVTVVVVIAVSVAGADVTVVSVAGVCERIVVNCAAVVKEVDALDVSGLLVVVDRFDAATIRENTYFITFYKLF